MKRIILTLTMALVATGALYSQNTGPSQSDVYYVKITDPVNDGFKAGPQCKISGEANIPSGYHLWVLCHRADFPKWWAQSYPKINQGAWHATVTVGENQDIGEDFEIIAIVVDNATDAQLKASYGQGIDLPDTNYSALRVVHKIK